MGIPRPIRKQPLRSIFALAICKMVLLPILGVLLVDGLVSHGLVASEDRVLRFVLVYFACVPSATFQVALSQVYCPDGVEANASILCM
jgi:predicted permease